MMHEQPRIPMTDNRNRGGKAPPTRQRRGAGAAGRRHHRKPQRKRQGRWLRRFLIAVCVVLGAVAGLYATLAVTPISVDFLTPRLEQAIRDNIGHDKTVEVGGTQIELVDYRRIALRLHDVVVRDRDQAVIASAPKVEVGLSLRSLAVGEVEARSIRLVDAELAVRIAPGGEVTVSTANAARPLASGGLSAKPPQGEGSGEAAQSGLLAVIDWLDRLAVSGLFGRNLTEIGLRGGNLLVDDAQHGDTASFSNVNFTLRRVRGGGVDFRLAQEGDRPWLLQIDVAPSTNGIREVDIRLDQVPASRLLRALRIRELTYEVEVPLTGELRAELGAGGVPILFWCKIRAGSGHIIDTDTPDYPMAIDGAEVVVEWDAERQLLAAPFRIVSGGNRITLMAQLVPPKGEVADWQLHIKGGSMVIGGVDDSPPLVFTDIALDFRFDTTQKRLLLTQTRISNGEIRIAGSGSIDYSAEPRLTLGVAATPMSVTSLKRLWPVLVVPEVREWVVERVSQGALTRLEIGVNSPVHNLSRKGPPIPDEGLSVEIDANAIELHPVDGLPLARNADMKVRVTGRTATITVAQAVADTEAGRNAAISDFVFKVADMAPKPVLARTSFRVSGQVPAAAEILSSDRLRDFATAILDPNTAKGSFTASVNLALPIRGHLSKADMTYDASAELKNFSAEKLVMDQKFEANTLRIIANNDGYQVSGDIKINELPLTLDYRKPASGDTEFSLQTTLDDAARSRFGFDLSPVVSGPLPVTLNGRISAKDQSPSLAVDCNLTPLRLANVLPGLVKPAGKQARATFRIEGRPQAILLNDIVVTGAGTSIRGSVELDESGELTRANFPTYQPSENDNSSLKVERGTDGVMKLTMRGDVFDGRGFLKSMVIEDTPRSATRNKVRNIDFDLDLRVGTVTGFNGETMRAVNVVLERRKGALRKLSVGGKIGRDAPVQADLSGDNIILRSADAGALLRFSDIYAKAYGGQLEMTADAPTAEPRARDGLLRIRDFSIRGDSRLEQRMGSETIADARNDTRFEGLCAVLRQENGILRIQDGILNGPVLGITISGTINYPARRVGLNGSIIPMHQINGIPIPGLRELFTPEGLFSMTYEVAGTPDRPDFRVNPLPILFPGGAGVLKGFNTVQDNRAGPWARQRSCRG
ncbi:MAG: DUF3971 domain-containing protein [Alphaproteobacteria bacterium]|nr:DUF3971 domain-containing protein [Alphaproteobacteria bacterium]